MNPKDINAAQQRLLRVVMLLGEDVVTGVAPSQIARELGVAASYITRDLTNLKEAGWAIKNEETGRWLLAAKVGALSIKVLHSIDRAERKLAEVRDRFTGIQ